MTEHLDMPELFEVFLEEADEQLQRLDDGILSLERNPGDTAVVNDIFRAAHTLKGSSATMGMEHIASLTHTMETLLDKVRSGQQSVTQPVVDALLMAVDALRGLLENVRAGSPTSAVPDEILEALNSISTGSEEAGRCAERPASSAANPCPDGCVRIEVRFVKDCIMPSVRGFMALNAIEGQADLISCTPDKDNLESLQPGGVLILDVRPSVPSEEILARLATICEIEASLASAEGESPKEEHKQESAKTEPDIHNRAMQTVRVGVDRLDTLMNLIGELVIDRTRIGQVENDLSARYDGDHLISGLGEVSLHIGRVINELQEQIMKIRMLPVDQVFNRFPRMVRDLARKANKKVEFVISGQETELDRSILEDIVDPITHLLRNSIDHGIESAEERIATGKPETALVRLSARHEENRIVIEVEDDGRGICAEAVKKAAVKKGTITQEAADRMSEKDALQLIFGAGVSTAEKITDVSGRGVGMDVVKNNIERLSGRVDVQTEVGAGTRISLRLPLTLAIVQALITSVDGRIFAIPLTSVVETSRYAAADICTMQTQPVIQFRGTVLPLVDLRTAFPSRKPSSKGDDEETVLVVVRAGGQQIGIGVDRLIGEQEVVIKSLGSYIGQVGGISGATLLGDGRIALIVDVAGLLGMLEHNAAKKAA